MLAIDRSSAYLIKQSEHTPIIRLIQPNIDPELIKGWLNYCQDNHSSACSGREGQLPSGSIASPLSAITSFKVIDCETRQIVNDSGAQYLALSYVWGADERGPEFSRTLPSQLPETIEDAIVITRSLGMRFIWIDRFCINQSEPAEVQEQVGLMDLIYSCAYLTIIAAAGENPNYGLPGVGKRCRQTQAHGLVRGHLLASSLPDPREAIQRSKWFQRGWTYQEGILSPRRLIFTDRQIYFECSGMYCCEALDLPLQSLHTQNGHRFRAEFCDKINIGMFPRGLGTSAWDIVYRIENYTKRQLTDLSDILKGFSGVLNAFARSRKRVLHCAGVPMIPASWPRRTGQESKPRLQGVYPLLGFCGGLCWGVDAPAERREGFPSWSWTGWQSKIKWGIEDFRWHLLEPNKDLKISIQLNDGSVANLEEFCHAYDDMNMKSSDTLHIATWTFPVRIWRKETAYSGLEYQAIVELEDGEPYVWRFAPTCITPILPDTKCIGIQLCHTTVGEPCCKIYVLILQEVETGVFERVGFGKLDGNRLTSVSEYKRLRFGTPELDNDDLRPLLSLWLPLPAPKKVWMNFRLR